MPCNVAPRVLPMRKRSAVIHQVLQKRFDEVLPLAMREAGFDMWIILCQEDNLDPVFRTMLPMDTWCPILQMLVFYDTGERIERINLSMTNMHDLCEKPWAGQRHEEQWPLLRQVVEQREPKRIGINIGGVQWAAGGLTHNLYTQLIEALPPKYVERLVSAEPAATRWLATLTDDEVKLYEHVVAVAHCLLAECYSRQTITPGVTAVHDLVWSYWQQCADLGLQVAFRPYFGLVRSQAEWDKHGRDDLVIRHGDFIRSDVGIQYLRLTSDHQEWAYVLRPGETEAPAGVRKLMAAGNRLQDVFMAEFRQGLTGNELLSNILARARREGVPNPKVYSHSLGLLLHEPGPLIGLPWEQERCEGRGDVRLEDNYAFTMELSVADEVPEWDGQELRFAMEQDVVFKRDGCRVIDGRQTEFYLV